MKIACDPKVLRYKVGFRVSPLSRRSETPKAKPGQPHANLEFRVDHSDGFARSDGDDCRAQRDPVRNLGPGGTVGAQPSSRLR